MELTFEVYYKGKLLGTCLKDERMALIKEHVAEPTKMNPGDIEFRVVSFK